MKIKKFNESFDSQNPYSVEIENEIKKFNSAELKTNYYVSTPDDKYPETRQCFENLDEAIDSVRKLNKIISDSYCIYEAKLRALTGEDIKLYLDSKKYNL
jgi:hypothetical protein